jgi:hypothetical protein
MSQEKFELMRRGFDHMVATGHPPWETIDRRIEVHDHSAERETYRGHAGLWPLLVWTVRGGQAVRLDVFGSGAQALEAVGVSE